MTTDTLLNGLPSYQPLSASRNEIRLLDIQPDPDETSVIHCQITKSSLEEANYVALSYCWGDADQRNDINIGSGKAKITKNLDGALREPRRQDHLSVWTDALCINQSDDEERSLQIRIMSAIYHMADTVLSRKLRTGIISTFIEIGHSFKIDPSRSTSDTKD